MKFDYDLFMEILSQLPIETLLRFRCLSKKCCSCIDSPDFIYFHLNRSIKTCTNRSLIIDDVFPEGSIYAVDLDSSESDRSLVELHRPYKPFVNTVESVLSDTTDRYIVRPRKFYSDVFGSCNGLLAMYNCSGVTLWNPSTKKHRNIPEFWSDIESNTCDRILEGFGYDPINNDYKVIMIYQRNELHYKAKLHEIKSVVYSLKGNCSTRIEDLNGYYISFSGHSAGVSVGGSLHWVVSREEKRYQFDKSILAFDLVNEKFYELPKPRIKGELFVSLSELGGSLAITYSSSTRMFIEIWVMKEYGIIDSWTKIIRIDGEENLLKSDRYAANLRPLCYSKTGGEILVGYPYDEYFVSYDLEEKIAKRGVVFRSPERESIHSDIPNKISANICMRSLVPVNFSSGIAESSSEIQSMERKRT
ncbi:F-box protein CPR1 [Manihot esculenta]|uniref:F-box domain-containing protein n=1 Tax=Manihot esculenta TaxID=3983 RepID=A0A2C9W1Q9_MANES|nr:F-box protein CPR1 [Manihot esculenta]OAY52870.1 hypothetical protein MANES_04G117700v8 [Manihot esculenta]